MTTTPDFRALCAELCLIWSRSTNSDDLFENMVPLVDRARAALATPPPEPPTDEELYDYWISTSPQFGCARAVLERWGK